MWRLVAVVLLAGCQFGAEVAQGTVHCDRDGVCPPSFRCHQRTGLCFAKDSASSGAPALVVTELMPSPAVLKKGDVLRARVTADRPLLTSPGLAIAQAAERRAMTLVQSDGDGYIFEYRASGLERQGSGKVLADLIGASGSEAIDLVAGVVEFDSQAPSVLSASIRVERPRDCPLRESESLMPAGIGSRVVIEALADEEVTFAVEASESVDFSQVITSQSYAMFRMTVGPVGVSGEYALRLRLVDRAGNESLYELGNVAIDRLEPSAPSEDALLHVLRPWGALGSPQPEYKVVGEVESGTSLQVVTQLRSHISDVAADGGVVVNLGSDSSQLVQARAVDSACNLSALTQVPHFEVTATLWGKVAGRTAENPHRLVRDEAFSRLISHLKGIEATLPVENDTAYAWR